MSFFVTARYAGNSDRAAYVEVVNEQLADMLGRHVPPYLTPAGQERLYWSLLAQAAEQCQRYGQRLLLMVDGLDEDRGVTTGAHARSIAALLPGYPLAGMRVIVAGRPDPPIPADVPPGHPLRDPDVVWLLRRSEHAATVRADMLTDLAELRDGGQVGQDVLGLVTAGGGGLASQDLAELMSAAGHVEVTDWDIDQLLATVAGRSFTRRNRSWQPGSHPVYVLGHEEIQDEATRSYGLTKLADYRNRLHTWAQLYRDRGWPADTPEYLLRGYYRLLLATGDLPRAVDCATDVARHDRMLDLSGGDTAALAEITDAQNAILASSYPDLPAMARLAYHRNLIAERNSNIPTALPAVWAQLGHPDRGEQLARAITDPDDQARALADLVVALAQAGEQERAEKVARSITNQNAHAQALTDLAVALAQAGEYDHARVIAADAEQVAHTIANPNTQAQALSRLAVALAQVGEHDHARAIAANTEQVARTITHPYTQARALADLVVALAEVGEHHRAEKIARTITHPYTQARALAGVVVALAHAGEHEYAEQVARTITNPNTQARALTDLALAFDPPRKFRTNV